MLEGQRAGLSLGMEEEVLIDHPLKEQGEKIIDNTPFFVLAPTANLN